VCVCVCVCVCVANTGRFVLVYSGCCGVGDGLTGARDEDILRLSMLGGKERGWCVCVCGQEVVLVDGGDSRGLGRDD